MLDEITPEEFDEWWAYYTLEPWGDEWRQACLVAAEAANAGKIALSPHLKRPLSRTDLVQPEDYLTTRKSGGISPEAFESIAAATYGNTR